MLRVVQLVKRLYENRELIAVFIEANYWTLILKN